jgi:hypothetical protein
MLPISEGQKSLALSRGALNIFLFLFFGGAGI